MIEAPLNNLATPLAGKANLRAAPVPSMLVSMTLRHAERPHAVFKAGSGQIPPYLAGREVEQNILCGFLADLLDAEAPPRDVVLFGPRGNGKTALLRWFEKECRGPGVESLWLTPKAIASLDALARALIPPRRFPNLLPGTLALGAAVAQASWRLEGHRDALAQLLTQRCRKAPVVVLLDEAHRLDSDVGEALFNASQEVRSSAPFLLILAGTPGLQQHLGTMGASFWNRCERLGIGRLTAEASAEAIEAPLAEHGVKIDADALAHVAADSQHYPYFVQLWGEALWVRTLAGDGARITQETAAAAQASVDAVRGDYYADRFAELKAKPLRPVAEALALAFQSQAALPDDGVDRIAESVSDNPRQALAEIRRLGYLWMPPKQRGGIFWEPGIPSLMDFVLRHRQQGPAPGAQRLEA